MQAKILKISSVILTAILVLTALIMGIADILVPERQSYHFGQEPLKNVFIKTEAGQTVESPGMKYRHYAPKASLKIIRGKNEKTM